MAAALSGEHNQIMSDERWERVEEPFHEAADLPPNQRVSFLERVCGGDDALRHEIESLLTHDDASNEGLIWP